MGSQGHRISQSIYYDFEELSMTAQGKTFELCKLDSTPFVRKSFELLSQDFALTRSSHSCRLKVAGENPSGLLPWTLRYI